MDAVAAPRPADGPSHIERMYAVDGISRALGITIDSPALGCASARMTVTAAMLNVAGTCHGGYLFVLADVAFGYACNSYGPAAVAAGADIIFLAPVSEGDELVAEATERTLHGRSGIYDITIRRGDTVVVEVRARSRVQATATR